MWNRSANSDASMAGTCARPAPAGSFATIFQRHVSATHLRAVDLQPEVSPVETSLLGRRADGRDLELSARRGILGEKANRDETAANRTGKQAHGYEIRRARSDFVTCNDAKDIDSILPLILHLAAHDRVIHLRRRNFILGNGEDVFGQHRYVRQFADFERAFDAFLKSRVGVVHCI